MKAERAPSPTGMLPEPGRPFEEHHLVAAVRFAAYVVVRYGEAYAPTFERLERALDELRRRRGPVERARLTLAKYTVEGSSAIEGRGIGATSRVEAARLRYRDGLAESS